MCRSSDSLGECAPLDLREPARASRSGLVARLEVRGTHLGSAIPFLRGVEPTGRAITWSHHHTFRFTDGRVAEHWANRDDLGFLRQVSAP